MHPTVLIPIKSSFKGVKFHRNIPENNIKINYQLTEMKSKFTILHTTALKWLYGYILPGLI